MSDERSSDGKHPGPLMRAVLVRAPGGPEQLAIEEVPAPQLVAGSLELEVAACALNRADLLQRRGAYPPPPGASELLGLECAGVVRAVRGDVGAFRVGDRVMALLAGGGYAQRVVVPHGHALPAPDGMSFEAAAAIPEAFLTASEALFSSGELAAGQWVLVHAAAGGVGSAAVQLARAVGARVIACAGSAEKVDWLRRLGADVVVNHRERDFAEACLEHTGGRGVDVVLDFVGASYAERHLRCVCEAGRWVVLGMLGGSDARIDLARVLRRRLHIAGLVMRSRSSADKAAIVARFSQRFLGLFEQGVLSPQIDRIYPLEEVRAAHERMERNENVGKIVLRVGG
ncbi:MAG TPA: NAD(P)H-quinone oxidoreductase [Polyangiaceae bacterium]|nr:NAD(P)H-quinone oxidoreductase [Polyangiaceae bacterium]